MVGIRHQLLGDKHPRFADSLSQAAEIYLTLGEATKAGALYGKASGIYREAFGITHPRYTETQARLAKLRQAASASAKMRSPPDQPASGGQGLDKGDLRPGLATPRSASTSASKDGKLTLWQAAQLMTVTPRLSQIIPLMNRGEFEEAARLAVEVEAVTRNVFEPTHPMYVRTLEMLAKTQEASGDVAAARKSWQKYLSLSTGLYGPQHWKVNEARWTLRELERRSRLATAPGDARQLREARHLHGTAIQLVSQGRYNAALETATKALAILDKTETRSDPIYLGTLADLAVILARLGETQRAVALGRKAVALAQQHLGREHPITARALGNLGGMLVDAGEYVEGESLCREFVEIIKKTYGPDHPQYAVGLSRLGDLHESMGDYPRAEPFFREAVNVAKANLTDDPLGYANRLANLAGLYVNMREYTRAEPLYLEAKAIIGKSLGEGHHEYAVALNRLAHLHVMTGSPEQAVPLLLRALEILRKTAGEEHASDRRSVRQLACAFAEMGKYDQAEELFQRVLKGTKSASGHHLAGYVSALNDLGGLYLAAGKYREAERCFREILEYARRDLRTGVPDPSERQQYAMLASQRASLDVYLSVAPRREWRWGNLRVRVALERAILAAAPPPPSVQRSAVCETPRGTRRHYQSAGRHRTRFARQGVAGRLATRSDGADGPQRTPGNRVVSARPGFAARGPARRDHRGEGDAAVARGGGFARLPRSHAV